MSVRMNSASKLSLRQCHTVAAAALGTLSKKWGQQLARTILKKKPPREQGAFAGEKETAKVLHALLSSQKGKHQGSPEGHLKMLHSHRVCVANIEGAM
eukprot:5730189-Amphidinium_carterae.1